MSFGGWRYEVVIPTILAVAVFAVVIVQRTSSRRKAAWGVGLWILSTAAIFTTLSSGAAGWRLDYQGFSYGVGLAAANSIPFVAVVIAAAIARAGALSPKLALPVTGIAAVGAILVLPWSIFAGAIISCAVMGNAGCL